MAVGNPVITGHPETHCGIPRDYHSEWKTKRVSANKASLAGIIYLLAGSNKGGGVTLSSIAFKRNLEEGAATGFLLDLNGNLGSPLRCRLFEKS